MRPCPGTWCVAMSGDWVRGHVSGPGPGTCLGTRCGDTAVDGFEASQDQHRIAERVEAVPLLDRELVEPKRLLGACEGHHEREQRRAGEVEVRQQGVRPE